jgi:hypothetical protein
MPDPAMPIGGELFVGIVDLQGERPDEVAIDFGPQPASLISFPPEYAVLMAQMLVKHARILGYTLPFVELPVDEGNVIH